MITRGIYIYDDIYIYMTMVINLCAIKVIKTVLLEPNITGVMFDW